MTVQDPRALPNYPDTGGTMAEGVGNDVRPRVAGPRELVPLPLAIALVAVLALALFLFLNARRSASENAATSSATGARLAPPPLAGARAGVACRADRGRRPRCCSTDTAHRPRSLPCLISGGPAPHPDDPQHQHPVEGLVPVLRVAPGQQGGQGRRPADVGVALPAQLGPHPPQP